MTRNTRPFAQQFNIITVTQIIPVRRPKRELSAPLSRNVNWFYYRYFGRNQIQSQMRRRRAGEANESENGHLTLFIDVEEALDKFKPMSAALTHIHTYAHCHNHTDSDGKEYYHIITRHIIYVRSTTHTITYMLFTWLDGSGDDDVEVAVRTSLLRFLFFSVSLRVVRVDIFDSMWYAIASSGERTECAAHSHQMAMN